MTAFATYPPQGMSARTRWQAFGMAAAIEAAVVVAVLGGAARHLQREEPAVLTINLMAPTTPPVAPPPRAKPDVPPPRTKSLSLPEVALPVVPEPSPTPLPPVASPPPVAVAHNVEPVAAPAAPAPTPTPAASAAPSAEYIARVRAAVQGAFEYPMAAKAQDFKGRTRVAFNLTDTHPGSARVIVSSGMSIVDRAALRAVEAASYPPPPEALSHVDQAFEVWVSFGV